MCIAIDSRFIDMSGTTVSSIAIELLLQDGQRKCFGFVLVRSTTLLTADNAPFHLSSQVVPVKVLEYFSIDFLFYIV